MRRFCLILLFTLLGTAIYAQEAVDLSILLEEIDDDEQIEIISERLEHLINNPVNLNEATAEELSEIPFFDDFFIRNLLLYRSKEGYIKSIYDLKGVQGAPINILQLLEPFLITEKSSPLKLTPKHNIYVGSEILLPQHYSPHKSVGVGIRYEGKIGHKDRWGIVLGKDRGEAWLPINKGLADHLSFSYQHQSDKGWHFTVGDYKITTGTGLLMGQSLGYFSKAEASSSAPSLNNRVIRPHISFREYDYLRGLAVGTNIGAFDINLFYGLENIDARIKKGKISTIYKGGMHRTKNEKKYRHTALLRTAGADISFHTEQLQVGITSTLHRYLNRSRKTLSPPKRIPLHNTSLYFQYLSSHLKLYGESLLTQKDKFATILGASYYNEDIGTISIIGRYLAPNHTTIYGYPDTYYSSGRNERGIKLIWKGELAYWWTASLYVDVFNKIELERGQSNKAGIVIHAKSAYTHNNTLLQGRIRWINIPNQSPRTTLRLNIHQFISPQWGVKGGGNIIYTNRDKVEWGIYTRLLFHTQRNIRAEVGLQYFNLKNSIIRSDNPSMPYRYYYPMLRGNGLRSTASISYPINNKVQIRGRASFTFYRKAPNTPIPSLLDICTIIKL